MKKLFLFLPAAAGLLFTISSCTYYNEQDLYPQSSQPPCDTSHVTFSGTIAPILNANCVVCHSGPFPPKNISLDTYAGVKIVADDGRLWCGVSHGTGCIPMPYQDGKLADCDLLKIRNWLDHGAPDN